MANGNQDRAFPSGLQPRELAVRPLDAGQPLERIETPLLTPDTSDFDPNKSGFDVTTFLTENNMKVISVGGERGNLIVENDITGDRREINAAEVLGQAGIDPNAFNFVLNRPATALPTSPLSVAERFQVIGLGNRKGQISWLRDNFEDVAEVPESRDLVVKQDGVGHRVDGDNFSQPDSWEWTKEVIADVAGVIPEIATGTAIGVAASLSGGTALLAAPLIGAGSETLRTSLGRLAGTYEATVDEQIADVAIESMLSLGGEAVAIGAKPDGNARS